MKRYFNAMQIIKKTIFPINVISIIFIILSVSFNKDYYSNIALILFLIIICLAIDLVYILLNELMYDIYYDDSYIYFKKRKTEKKLLFTDVKCIVVSGYNLFLLKDYPNYKLKNGGYRLYNQLKKENVIFLGDSDDILIRLVNQNVKLIFKKPNLLRKRMKKYVD